MKQTHIRYLLGAAIILILLGKIHILGAIFEGNAVPLKIEGRIYYMDDIKWKRLKAGIQLSVGDQVKSGDDSIVDLAFSTGEIIRLLENSIISIVQITRETSGMDNKRLKVTTHFKITLVQGIVLIQTRGIIGKSSCIVRTDKGDIVVKPASGEDDEYKGDANFAVSWSKPAVKVDSIDGKLMILPLAGVKATATEIGSNEQALLYVNEEDLKIDWPVDIYQAFQSWLSERDSVERTFIIPPGPSPIPPPIPTNPPPVVSPVLPP